MRNTLFLFCLLFCSGVFGQSSIKRITVKFKAATDYSIDYARHTIRVQDKQAEAIISKNNLYKISSLVQQNSVAALPSAALVKNIHFLQFDTDKPAAAIIAELMQTNLFAYAEEDVTGKGGGQTSVTPNDTYFSRQWGLLNNGSFNAQAIAGADIKMTEAWATSTGSTSTVVCVLDAGVKLDHPEFAGRLWVNPGEIANNNIDDDGNGYVDDVNGWDWANNDKDPTDDHGHGTNVAGIIGANANNSMGYAGVNWNCKLMIGKILNSANTGLYSWWINGIYYAVAKGAKVINMSVGGSGFSQAMQDACDFAYANNVTIVACMMNDNNSVPYYPAAYASTIAVGATTVNDYRADPFAWGGGSSYGPHIDVVAPGNFIYGLSYLSDANFDTYWSGTSQATPLVTGLVSLMYGIKPSLTVDDARAVLRTTAIDRVGNPAEDIAGFDPYMGYGKINAAAALVSSILPVTMGALTARMNQEKAILYWKTYTETNIRQFEIEQSAGLFSWRTAAVVFSKGSNNGGQAYSFTNNLVENETNYYRLKIIDKDGSFSYSNICILKPDLNNKITLLSTVLRDEIKLTAVFKQAGQINYFIYASNGALLQQHSLAVNAGTSVLAIRVNNLAQGFYIIKIADSKNQVLLSEKFLRQ